MLTDANGVDGSGETTFVTKVGLEQHDLIHRIDP
jgi:hypothetical protein